MINCLDCGAYLDRIGFPLLEKCFKCLQAQNQLPDQIITSGSNQSAKQSISASVEEEDQSPPSVHSYILDQYASLQTKQSFKNASNQSAKQSIPANVEEDQSPPISQ